MLVKCINNLNETPSNVSRNDIKIGERYAVLAITSASDNESMYYFIQLDNGKPNWIDSKLFEVVDSKVYSGWVIDVSFENNIETINALPKPWKENSEWFMEEIKQGTTRAKELFESESTKIIADMRHKLN